MANLIGFFTARRGHAKSDWTDWFAYGYLLLGLVLMFGPVLWLVLSSFKSAAALDEFPPRLLPYGQETAAVPGRVEPMPLFRVELPGGTAREVVVLRRIGIEAAMA